MKRYLFTIILLFASLCLVNAQEWWDGNDCNIGSFSGSFNFRTTYDATVRGKYELHNEVSFTFSLTKEMRMTFSSRSVSNDTSSDTYIQLEGLSRDYTDFPSDDYFEQTLPPGTYHLLVAKFDSKKMVAINISGKYNDPSSTFNAGYYDDAFTYTDTRNTMNYGDNYGLSTGDVTYNFTIAKTFDLCIQALGENSQRATAYLLDSSGGLIQDAIDGMIYYDGLAPGDYSVVVEGEDNDMEITTHIIGTFPTPISMSEIGSFDTSFLYSEEEQMDGYVDIVGNELGDVVYGFTLVAPMAIYVSHEGSAEQRTAIHLWDVELNEIGNNVSHPSDIPCSNPNQASMSIFLQAGRYYVVSESLDVFNDDYSRKIFTSIEGILLSEMRADTTQNYIITRTMTNKEGTSFIDKIQYFDGLGFPIETVQRKASPLGRDLITYQEYDGLRRESNLWLPRVGTDGSGKFVALTAFQLLSPEVYNNDTKAYVKLVYEESQLNRLVEQYGAGEEWHNHHKSTQYSLMTNVSGNDTLNCLLFKVGDEFTNDTLLALKRVGNYESHQLYVTRVEDEDGHRTFEFKDKLDRLVLSRQMDGNAVFDTYYLYNGLGNPLIVLPPQAADLLATDTKSEWDSNDEILRQYAYLYKYDCSRTALCQAKKLPGCAWTFYLYDKNNRLIFTQDGNQRQHGEWAFTLPDISGRTCMTGVCHNVFNVFEQPVRNQLVIVHPDYNEEFCYSIKDDIIALENPTVLNINYYDTYRFSTIGYFDNQELVYTVENGFDKRFYTENAVGLPTGSLTAVMKEGEVEDYLPSILYYDERGRQVQMKSTNHLIDGVEEEYVAYNFVGQALKRKHVHFAEGKASQTELYTYTYDHMGRLLTTTHRLNANPPIVLVNNKYDAIGRLASNSRSGQANLKTDYTYNVRSWLQSVGSPLFTQTLHYTDGTGIPCYNGNISSMTWKTSSDAESCGYKFEYDALNRLKNVVYGEGNLLSDNTGRFNEQITGYDKMGNILGLLRYGQTGTDSYGLIDNLNLVYNGNQLQSVYDNATNSVFGNGMEFKDNANETVEYAYDKNGNLTKDLNKKITGIQYNILNLPCRIEFENGNSISYVYAADGTKLRTMHVMGNDTSVVDYCGNVIYGNGAPKTLLTEAGYVTLNDNKYHYFIQDHQGNNRVVVNPNGTVEEKNDYYPLGGLMSSSASNSVQPYKYNGKELDGKGGLNWYDYGARHYDPVLGRWHVVDPLAEKYYLVSPYAYCAGNPVKFVDTDGRKIRLADNYTGAMVNIAQIAATNLGNQVLSQLISSGDTYTMNSVFWSTSSKYDVGNREINYVGSPSINTVGGGAWNSMLAMGHETFHAFDHDNHLFNAETAPYSRDVAEPRAVSFANDLARAYSLTSRETYGSLEGDFHQFSGGDKISNFKSLGSNSDKTSSGFSYTKTTITVVGQRMRAWGIPEPIRKTQTSTYYMTVNMDKNRNVTYQIYDNEEEYEKAISNW